MASKAPATSREAGHWHSARQRLREAGRVLAVTLLCGFLLGAGIALAKLSVFSSLPGFSVYLIAVISGAFIGLLIRQLSHGLVTLLLITLLGALLGTLALAYPEFEARRLGVELGVEFSAVKALTAALFSMPFLVGGLFVGKFLSRHD